MPLTEARKAYEREYRNRPEVRKRRLERGRKRYHQNMMDPEKRAVKNAYDVEYRKRPEVNKLLRERQRERKHGMKSGTYVQMLHVQRDRCAICQEIMERPCVDHCHETGKVRGLLCCPCNRGLFRFEKDPQWARRALAYLGGD